MFGLLVLLGTDILDGPAWLEEAADLEKEAMDDLDMVCDRFNANR
jgi:hypothetical protein